MRFQKTTRIIKIVAINILILTILTEIVLRIFGLPKIYKPRTLPVQFSGVKNEDILYVNVPNSEINFIYDGNTRGYFNESNTVNHNTNKEGFRGPEFSPQKPANTVRIIFLGDSFTFGEGVYQPDTFIEQFKEMALDKKLFGGRQVEAINLGVGAYNTTQEWALLRDFAAKGQPDGIVLGYTLNDAEPYRFFLKNDTMKLVDLAEMNGASNLVTPPEFAWSRILSLVWQKIKAGKIGRETVEYYNNLYGDDKIPWQMTKTALAGFGSFSRDEHVPVVTVIFPMLYRLDDYPFSQVQEKVTEVLTANNLPYIDIRPALKGYNYTDLWVHPTDQHPNEIVHKKVAELLIKYFSDNPIIFK